MKNAFRFLFIALVFATAGLFAQAATEPVTTSAHAQHKVVKMAKKKHHKHKKKAGK